MSIIDRIANILRPKSEVISTSAQLEKLLLENKAAQFEAFTIPAVASAVSLLAESVAQLPLHMYERVSLNGGRSGARRVDQHPVAQLLRQPMTDTLDAFAWREHCQMILSMHGNTICWKIRAGSTVIELYPLPIRSVFVNQRQDRSLEYRVSMPNGSTLVLQAEDVLHLRDRSLNGYTGDSRIKRHAQSLELAKEAENYGVQFFRNSASPSGLLVHPGELGVEGAKQLKEMWDAQADAKRFGLKVLDGGLDYKQLTIKNTDAEFNQTRVSQVTEIARIFRIPPHMIADLSRATFSNIEQQSQEFVQYALMPWLKRWEAALAFQLLTPAERQRYWFAFNVEGFLRGDFKTRVEGYASGLQNGWMSVNEVRALENRDPIEGGDTYRQAANLFGDNSGGNNEPQQ